MDNKEKPSSAELMREARIKMIKIASVGIAGAIILACYAYTKVEDALVQTVLFGISSFICVIAGLFIMGTVALGREQRAKRNFFLYDSREKKDIEVKDLTVSRVRERMCEFMNIFKRRGKLYIGDLFDENPHIPEHFKPLFCYEILCQLASGEGHMDARTFLSFGRECAEVFVKYLRENRDYELALSINSYICEYSPENNNSEKFAEYLKTHKEHIESKMLSYAVENIEKFK